MKIQRFLLGELGVNTYLVIGENESFVIDPASNDDNFIKELPLNLKYIINTHGHFDHIAGNSAVKKITAASIVIHENDEKMLLKPEENLSSFMGITVISPKADIVLKGKEGSILIDGKEWKYLNTPGHTEGSIVLFNEREKVIFGGDLIFEDSFGRIDLPGGDGKKMKDSLTKILSFSDDFLVYAGHGESFILKDFKNWINYFLKDL